MSQKIVKYNDDLIALVNQHIEAQSSPETNNDDTNPIFKQLFAKGHFTISLLGRSVFDKLQACFGKDKPLPLIGQQHVIVPSSVDAKLTHTVTINYLNDDEGDQSGGSGSPSVGPIHYKNYKGPRLTFADIDTMLRASEANIRKNQKVPNEDPVFNEN
jgi:hypothetical protein